MNLGAPGLRTLALGALPAVAALIVFAPALATGRVLAVGDGWSYLLPLYMVAAEAWGHGEIPGWNPFAFSGSPLLAIGQAGVFYPPNVVFLVLPPLIANNVAVLTSFAIAGTGAFLLARHLWRDDVGAAVAGLGFALSGFMFGHIGHQAIIAGAAWLPWTLLGFELVRERFSPGRLLLAGGSLALVLLAGHSQMFFIVLVALAVYAAVLAVSNVRRQAAVRPVLAAAALAAVGLALSAVQLVPTASILDETVRSRIDFDTATTFSFPLSHLPLLLFPYLFGNTVAVEPFSAVYQGQGNTNLTELAGYPGLASLVFAAAGLTAGARRDRRVIALAVTGLVALVIALGRSTPFAYLVYELPVYGQFRAWGRYVVVFDLVIALLAAYGIATLRGSPRPRRRAAFIGAALATAVVVVAAVVAPRIPAVSQWAVSGRPKQLAIVLPLAAALVGLGCCLFLVRGRRAVAVALALLIVPVDAVASFGAFREWRRSPRISELERAYSPSIPPQWGATADAPGGIDRYIYTGPPHAFAPGDYVHTTDAKRIRSANGLESLAPADYLEATGEMHAFGYVQRPHDLFRPDSRVLDLLRVSVVVTERQPPHPPREEFGAPRPVSGGEFLRWEYEPRVPDVFLVGSVRRASRADVLAAIQGRRPFDPADTALIESQCEQCERMTRPGSAGVVTNRRWGTNSIEIDAVVERPALLVVSQAWFPGWSASVDGESAPVLRTDALLTGVPLGAGRHRVELWYRPPGLALGAFISLVSLAALTGWLVVARRASKVAAARQIRGSHRAVDAKAHEPAFGPERGEG